MLGDHFPILAQFDTTVSDFAEIGSGARIQIVGQSIGVLPQAIRGNGQYAFNMESVGQVSIQGYKLPVSTQPNIITDALAAAFRFDRVDRRMSNEHMIIAALVRQLGGAASVSEHEIQLADKVKHMTSYKLDGPLRFQIKVED